MPTTPRTLKPDATPHAAALLSALALFTTLLRDAPARVTDKNGRETQPHEKGR